MVEDIGVNAGLVPTKRFNSPFLVGEASCVDSIGVTDFGKPAGALQPRVDSAFRAVCAKIDKFPGIRFKIEKLRRKA